MNKKIIILSLCLSGCASIQDDIKIVDELLQAEEKIYDEHEKRNKDCAAHVVAKPNGRPRKEIDLSVVEGLCKINCTQEEICNFLKVNHETLGFRLKEAGYDSFPHFYNEKKTDSTISQRRKIAKKAEELLDQQFEIALGYKEIEGKKVVVPPASQPQVTMSIWLGKQYLGQKEPIRIDEIKMSIDQAIINQRTKEIEKNTDDLKRFERFRSKSEEET